MADLAFPGCSTAPSRSRAHARARVVRIDTSRAARHPGVMAIVTAKDVPGRRFYGLIVPDWPGFVAEGEETRCVGDVLAAVAAVDARTARAAAALVDVDVRGAPARDRPRGGAAAGRAARGAGGQPPLALGREARRRGRRARRLGHVVEGTWRTQRIEHLYLEPEACVAVPGDAAGENPRPGSPSTRRGRASSTTGGRSRHSSRSTRKRCTSSSSRTAARSAARRTSRSRRRRRCSPASTGQPVRARPLARGVHAPPPEAPSDPDRLPRGLRRRGAAHGRPRPDDRRLGRVRLGRSARSSSAPPAHAAGPYRCANLDVEALAVYTNNPPCGAMRGFGANQAHFAIEGALDMLAEKAGLDRWEIRWRNALEAGDTWSAGQTLTASVGLKKTLLAVKKVWDESGGRAGIACGIKNCGIGNGAKEWGRARLVVEAGRPRHDLQRLHGDGAGPPHGPRPVRVRDDGPPARRLPRARRHALPDGGGPDDGLAGDVPRRARRRRRGPEAPRRPRLRKDARGPRGHGLRGRGPLGRHDRARAEPPPGRPRKLHPAFGFATQVVVLDEKGRVVEGRRRPRRRARDQPEALRGADRGRGPHGPRLRAHGGDGLRGRDADVLPDPRHGRPQGRRTCPRSR